MSQTSKDPTLWENKAQSQDGERDVAEGRPSPTAPDFKNALEIIMKSPQLPAPVSKRGRPAKNVQLPPPSKEESKTQQKLARKTEERAKVNERYVELAGQLGLELDMMATFPNEHQRELSLDDYESAQRVNVELRTLGSSATRGRRNWASKVNTVRVDPLKIVSECFPNELETAHHEIVDQTTVSKVGAYYYPECDPSDFTCKVCREPRDECECYLRGLSEFALDLQSIISAYALDDCVPGNKQTVSYTLNLAHKIILEISICPVCRKSSHLNGPRCLHPEGDYIPMVFCRPGGIVIEKKNSAQESAGDAEDSNVSACTKAQEGYLFIKDIINNFLPVETLCLIDGFTRYVVVL